MRGRHKAWAAPLLNDHPELAVHHIDASSSFFLDRPLALEIGIGKGDFIVDQATKHPTTHFLGLERDVSIMGMAAKKILGKELQNILLCPEDFDTVEEELRPLKFETIYLNFSDPWPKKRHEKRRLTFLPRLQKIGDLLQEGGMLRIKTDNDNLYAFTLEQVQGLKSLTMVMNEEDYRFDEEGDSMSEYERNFRSIGHKIHRIILKKE